MTQQRMPAWTSLSPQRGTSQTYKLAKLVLYTNFWGRLAPHWLRHWMNSLRMCHVSPKLSFNYQLRYLLFCFHPFYFIFLVYMLEANSCIAACYLLRQVWLVALLDLHAVLSSSSLCLKHWDSSFSRSRVDLRLHLHDWCIEYAHFKCAYCWRPFTICTALPCSYWGYGIIQSLRTWQW